MSDVKFKESIEMEAKLHARKEFPKEICGFVVDNKYIPQENIHDDPENHFKISPKVYLELQRKYGIQAVVHSHSDDFPRPSKHDLESQVNSNIPWCIVFPNKNPVWFGESDMLPLLGREFVYGVTDCSTLVRDWYKLNKKIDLHVAPTDYNWWKDNPSNWYVDQMKDLGFEQLSKTTIPKIGDVYLSSIESDCLNHSFIYIGNDMVMHHLLGRLSVREPLSKWYSTISVLMRLKGVDDDNC